MKLKRAPNSSQNSHSMIGSRSRPKAPAAKAASVSARQAPVRARRFGASASQSVSGVSA